MVELILANFNQLGFWGGDQLRGIHGCDDKAGKGTEIKYPSPLKQIRAFFPEKNRCLGKIKVKTGSLGEAEEGAGETPGPHDSLSVLERGSCALLNEDS